MSLATITSKGLSQIRKLVERKEALTQQIAEINSELDSIESGVSAPVPSAITATPAAHAATASKAAAPAVPWKKRRAGRTVRGQLKERITGELKSAGKQGMKVSDLAAKLGTTYGNVTAFFQSTGKKIYEIKKVGLAQYAWKSA